MPDPQLARQETARHAERIAEQLDKIAARIRSAAKQFETHPDLSATKIAAEVLSEYHQTGTIGAIVWQLINSLDRH